MNSWTEKSFTLYKSKEGYLDSINEIYIMNENPRRKINNNIERKIKESFEKRDSKELLKLLLTLDKFPIKDSYKQFFTRCKKEEVDTIIENNPITVNRICNRIYSLGEEKMLEGMTEAKETNRQIGPMFSNWVRNKYSSYYSTEGFLKTNDSISILKLGDRSSVDFVANTLNVILPKFSDESSKGLDLVAKVTGKDEKLHFVIGEAKFITDFGGHQNAQLNDALNLITADIVCSSTEFDIIPLAILDGVCWINSSNTEQQKKLKALGNKNIAISATLLDDFFKETITTI